MDHETGDTQDTTLSADEQKAAAEQSDATETTEGQKPEAGKDAKTEKAEGDAAGDKPEDQDEDSDDPDKPRKRLTGAAKWRERARRAEAELNELRSRPPERGDGAGGSQQQQARADAITPAEIEAEIGPPPKETDFADWFQYQQALTEYAADKAIAKKDLRSRKAEQASRAREDRAETVEEFNGNARAFAKDVPDYADVVGKSDVELRNFVTDLIVESEKGPLILYHLAKNPDRAEALNRMSPVAAAKEIGRLETRLAPPKPQAKATQASKPESSLRGGAAHTKDPKDMSMEEFVRWREAGGG